MKGAAKAPFRVQFDARAPQEIKGADGQVRLSSIYERAAAE